MKIAYTVKKIDEGKKLKDIIKKKLYVSNVLLSKLKLTDSILVNNSLQHVSYTLCENDKILLDFENMKNVIYNDKNNVCYKKEKYLDKYQRFEYDLDILYEGDNLKFTMPANNFTVVACFEKQSSATQKTYQLTVTGGTIQGRKVSSGSFPAGERITVEPENKEGYKFNGWSILMGNKEILDIQYEGDNLKFTMPAKKFTIVARFTKI